MVETQLLQAAWYIRPGHQLVFRAPRRAVGVEKNAMYLVHMREYEPENKKTNCV